MRSLSRFLRNEGILLPHDAAACLSSPMTDADLDQVSAAFDKFLVSHRFASQEAQL